MPHSVYGLGSVAAIGILTTMFAVALAEYEQWAQKLARWGLVVAAIMSATILLVILLHDAT